ncbi:MAG: diguanylate cyclase [Myxococcaceae bacterium]|nr:diguanylate cyclase [Myxococcaceae bacterium]
MAFPRNRLAQLLAVFLAYAVAGKLGLLFAFDNASVTALWAPSGIALAALLLLGYGAWPFIFVAAFAVNATNIDSMSVALGISVGNTLEAVIAAYLVNRFARGREFVNRPPDTMRFAALAGLVSPAIAATCGVSMLIVGGRADWAHAAPIWLTWWLGDAGGMVLVAPAIVLWVSNPQVKGDIWWIWEAVRSSALLVVAGHVVFGGWLPQHVLSYPVAYLFVPALLWTAFRLGPRETTAASLLLAGFAIWGTLKGRGPFVARTPNESLLLLQTFMTTTAVIAMALAALIEERKRVEASRDQLAAIVASSTDAIIGRKLDGTLISWNAAAERLFGYPASEVLGTINDGIVPLGRDFEERSLIGRLQQGERIEHFETTHHKRDGEPIELSLTLSPIKDPGNSIIGMSVIARDITDRRKTERALASSNQELSMRLVQLEKRSQEIVLLSEMGGLLQTCHTNEEAFEVVGTFAEQLFPSEPGFLAVAGATKNLMEAVVTWKDPVYSRIDFSLEECWALRRAQAYTMEAPQSGPFCQHLLNPLPASYLCVPIMAEGETLGVVHIQARARVGEGTGKKEGRSFQAIQRLALSMAQQIALSMANLKLRANLRAQAIRDPLTGLFNRRYLTELFDLELRRAERAGHSVGVIMLDLDHFKKVNDTYGHAAGDALLCEVSKVLQAHCRGGDLLCRYGGEEFILVMPNASLRDTHRRAETIREILGAQQVTFDNRPLSKNTVSLGVAVFPHHGPTSDVLLRAADAALYRAKHNGRDQVVVADTAWGSSVVSIFGPGDRKHIRSS